MKYRVRYFDIIQKVAIGGLSVDCGRLAEFLKKAPNPFSIFKSNKTLT